MTYLTLDDIFNALVGEIRAQFPAVRFDFAGKAFPQRPELWVYVLDMACYLRKPTFG